MKIGIVSPHFYPWYGGITEHVSYLYRHLKRKGHSVKIITPFDGGDRLEEKNDLIKVGKPIPFFSNGSLSSMPYISRKRRTIQRIMEREMFDVLHLHQPLFCPLSLGFLNRVGELRRMGAESPRIVGTFHACGGKIERMLVQTFSFYFRRYSSVFDELIAVSPAARDFVATLLSGDFDIIPNGIDIARFAREGPGSVSRGAGDNVANILFVGRLEPRKGVTALLRSLEYVPSYTSRPFRLLMVGNGITTAYYRGKVPGSVTERVEFIGKVAFEDLPGYYRKADLFCSPAVYGESFGTVLIEAMASGVPIIAGDNEGYRTVLRHRINALLVDPQDPLSIAAAIAELLNSQDLCRRLASRGMEDARNFDWGFLIERIESLYIKSGPGAAKSGQTCRP